MVKQNDVNVNVRISRSLKELMEKFVTLDSHINISDLVRDAVREKIQREAPQLYRQLFDRAFLEGAKPVE